MGKPDAPRIYCSGPLFNPEERAAMASLADVLERAGYTTFLPQRDGVEMLAMRAMKTPVATNVLAAPGSKMMRKSVFGLDLHELLERSDAVVVNLDGRVPDEGAIVEATLAFAVGRPVVGYKNDARAPFRGMDNPMLSGVLGWEMVATLEALPAAVAEALKRAIPRDAPIHVSKELREVLDFGRKVRALLDRFPALAGFDKDTAPLMEKLEGIG